MRIIESAKRLLITLIIFFSSVNICFAQQLFLEEESSYQKKIMQIGFRVLNANEIEKRIVFYYNNDKTPEMAVYYNPKVVMVNKGMLPYMTDDDELAAMLSSGIAQLTEAHKGFFKRITISFSPRKYEVKADKKAVDLIVNAGYDPIALINIINKTAEEPCWYEYNIFRHNGSERTVYIYQYIYEKYPIYLIDNKYLTNVYYQNFLYNTKKDREKARKIQEERVKLHKMKKETVQKI